MYKSIKTLFAASVVAFPLLSVSGGSFAASDDAKFMHGSSCNENTLTANRSSQWGILNISTTADMTVYCPVVRDVFASNTATANVYVVDANANTGASVRCRLVHYRTDGTSSITAYKPTATGSSPGLVQKLSLGPVTLGEGPLLVECIIPPAISSTTTEQGQSKLLHYSTNEHQN